MSKESEESEKRFCAEYPCRFMCKLLIDFLTKLLNEAERRGFKGELVLEMVREARSHEQG
ncbi:MAG: hypothetical protein QXT14_03050 [Candidatus Bathyarchaeia archaeon]